MRIPIVPDISSRDGSSTKNGRMYNVLSEKRPNGDRFAAVRPGLTQSAATTGSGKGLVCWDGTLVAMYGTSAVIREPSYTLTLGTTPDSNKSWSGMAWNGVVFCMVNSSPPNKVAATSEDGITWTARTLNTSGNRRKIAALGTTFCTVSGGASSVAETSTDGVTWTTRTMPSSAGWVAIAANGTIFLSVAAGTVAATSSDGATWIARTMPVSTVNSRFAIDAMGSLFCVVDYSEGNSYTTTDGITWNTGTMPVAGNTWNDIANNGSVFVAIGGIGFATDVAAVSADGLNWTLVTMPVESFWKAIIWNGELFVAFGSASGYPTGTDVATSPDGIDWTYRPQDIFTAWGCAEWNGEIIAVAASGGKVASGRFADFETIGTVTGTFFDFAQSPT